MTVIAQGAEAIIKRTNQTIIKERPIKMYRIKEIDEPLRKSRTRREAKILEKLAELHVPVPRILSVEDTSMTIEMEYIDGRTMADVSTQTLVKTSEQVGKNIGTLHFNDIVHGDLTTANMILKDNTVFLIDFGLSSITKKDEDKAVDLHVLYHALESHHSNAHQEAWKNIIEGYKTTNKNHASVLKRLEKVEMRGRNKGKVIGTM